MNNLKKLFNFLYIIIFIPLTSEAAPNIITIVLDDVSFYQIGYNNPYYKTPNIDSLITNGVTFDNALAYPKCSPTRNALLTGRNPARIGATQVLGHTKGGDGDSDYTYLPLEEPDLSFATPNSNSIASEMAKFNYKSGFIGKWHVNIGDGIRPNVGTSSYGYDEFINLKGMKVNKIIEGSKTTKVCNGPDAHRNKEFTNNAIEWLNNTTSGEPFYLTLHYHAIHGPHCVDNVNNLNMFEQSISEKGSQNNAMQAAMMYEVDEQIGKVLKLIESKPEKFKNTVFIFYSDNGAYIENPDFTLARGAKGSLYQGGIHVPLIISGDVVKNKQRHNSALVMPEDLFATTLSIAANSKDTFTLPSDSDSVTLWPALKNKNNHVIRNGGVIHTPHYSDRAQKSRWKGGTTPSTAFIQRPTKQRTEQWKLILNWEQYWAQSGGTYELYNLVADPLEQVNLAAERKEFTEKLTNKLRDWVVKGEFKVPGKKSEIFSNVWALSNEGRVYTQPQNTKYKIWKKIETHHLRFIHISSGTDFVWAIDHINHIFKCAKPCSGQWQWIPTKYIEKPKFVKISSGENSAAVVNSVWAIDEQGRSYKCTKPCNGHWQQISTHLKIKDISSGSNFIWSIDHLNHYFKCAKPCNGNWQHKEGKLHQLDAGDTELWGLYLGGIYKMKVDGSQWWQWITGNYKQVTIGKSHIFSINNQGDSFKCERPCNGQSTWKQIKPLERKKDDIYAIQIDAD